MFSAIGGVKKIMSSMQSGDWSSTKRSKIIMLREKGHSYAAFAKGVGGIVITSGVRKFC